MGPGGEVLRREGGLTRDRNATNGFNASASACELMDGETTRIGMVAFETTPGSGRQTERQMRAGRSVEDERREHASLQAAGDRCGIGWIDQPLRHQACNDLVLHGIGDPGAMTHACVAVEKRIQGAFANRGVRDPPRVVFEELDGRSDQRRLLPDLLRAPVSRSDLGLVRGMRRASCQKANGDQYAAPVHSMPPSVFEWSLRVARNRDAQSPAAAKPNPSLMSSR